MSNLQRVYVRTYVPTYFITKTPSKGPGGRTVYLLSVLGLSSYVSSIVLTFHYSGKEKTFCIQSDPYSKDSVTPFYLGLTPVLPARTQTLVRSSDAPEL